MLPLSGGIQSTTCAKIESGPSPTDPRDAVGQRHARLPLQTSSLGRKAGNPRFVAPFEIV